MKTEGLIAVVATGSRDWSARHPVGRMLQERKPDLVIHGAYRGLDTVVDTEARIMKIATLPMPAQWEELGPLAGPSRNGAMTEMAKQLRKQGWTVTCEAFPGSASRGTFDCMKQMKEAGFLVNDHTRTFSRQPQV